MAGFNLAELRNIQELIFFAGAFLIALIAGFILIPVLKRLKFGQTIRDDGPQTHLHKQGTPTMGGLLFLIAIVSMSLLAYFALDLKQILPVTFVTAGFGFVGFLDDWLKIVRKNKDGLKPWQKMAGLFIVAILFCLYLEFVTEISTTIHFALFGLDLSWDLKYFFIPFTVFVLLCSTNGANLTDGVDGLNTSVTFVIMMFFVFANASGTYLNKDLSIFAAICAGSLIGFLIYNMHPAKVFMGDMGSLALGGAVGSCAILMQRPFLVLLVGIIYVAEMLSVIIQVQYYKRTKKRIFRMAPLHHHFEVGGWSEKKVVRVFVLVTAVVCGLAYASMHIRIF